MDKVEQIKSGKAKSLFSTNDDNYVIVEYRNDTSAFDGKKLAKLDRKGVVNNYFNAFIMELLEKAGIATHHVKILSDNESLIKKLEMFPVECVVRNVATGSLVRRLGVEDGLELEPPLFEFFLKDDALGDPMINEFHIETFGWADADAVQTMKELTFKVNGILKPLFLNAGMILVDYKLEFGRHDGKILLGDEFTPDGCRIWDVKTRKKLDKDRFRQDLGDVIEAYEEVAHRLNIPLAD